MTPGSYFEASIAQSRKWVQGWLSGVTPMWEISNPGSLAALSEVPVRTLSAKAAC